jgi:phosphatidate phosphatase APP1
MNVHVGEDRTDGLQVAVYDAYARIHPRHREWQMVIRGSVGTPRPDSIRRRLFLRIVQRALRFTDEQMASEVFQDRVRDFLMVPEKRCEIQVSLNGADVVLPKKTRSDGSFLSSVLLSHSLLSDFSTRLDSPQKTFRIETVTVGGVEQEIEAEAELIPPEGVSVISDIDDTLKLSQVGDRLSLLANTFLRPFAPVPGMADVYRIWKEKGAVFHYVSSSPWQLHRPLRRFMYENGFPPGTFHLRPLRLRGPRIVELFMGRKSAKRRSIKGLLRWYPQRRFILIGDSGEKDPEIYGAFCRKFPQQVSRIFIRRIPGTTLDPDRLKRAFRRIPRNRWQIFDEPAELEQVEPV